MASSYSTSLKLELIGSGDQSGTWGTTTNTNLGTLLEQAIVGQSTITMANADYTLTDYNGVSDEARNAVIIISGSQNASYNVICPAQQKLYMITNSLSAGATAYFKPTGGSALTIANGNTVLAYCTGTSMVALNFVSSSTNATNATNATNLTGSGTISSTTTGTTQAASINNTTIATTAFVRSIIPAGVILLWSGSTASIPTGWYLCNGTNGTPNLQDRFVVGAGSGYAVGATGGTADAVVVSHSHTASSAVSDPTHTHASYPNSTGFITYGAAGVYGHIAGINPGGAFSDQGIGANPTTYGAATGISVSTTVDAAGVSGVNQNLPPYYALAYIMKS